MLIPASKTVKRVGIYAHSIGRHIPVLYAWGSLSCCVHISKIPLIFEQGEKQKIRGIWPVSVQYARECVEYSTLQYQAMQCVFIHVFMSHRTSESEKLFPKDHYLYEK